jgi:zinc transport system ATP-binding protein
MPDPVLLEIRDLTVERDGRRVLSDVALSVAGGSIHLLVGPNGAGKSTLLGAVLGRVVFSGTIRVHWRGTGRIGYVPQSFAVDRTLPVTVAEFLALGRQRRPICLGLRRAQRRRIDALLARVGLSGFSGRLLSALSGGELQRVLLANAIDPEPELLLLDEPARGLDEASVGQLEAVLKDLPARAGRACSWCRTTWCRCAGSPTRSPTSTARCAARDARRRSWSR